MESSPSGDLIPRCYTCHHAFVIPHDECIGDFTKVSRILNEKGWRSKKENGRWRNYCYDCVVEWRHEKLKQEEINRNGV